jgi:site-specific recombinase XerC
MASMQIQFWENFKAVEQGTIKKTVQRLDQADHLLSWVGGFLVDRKAQNLNPGTLEFYRKKQKLFSDFAESREISQVTQITPSDVRIFLLYLEEKGHNPGGLHAAYRALRSFLRWWEG